MGLQEIRPKRCTIDEVASAHGRFPKQQPFVIERWPPVVIAGKNVRRNLLSSARCFLVCLSHTGKLKTFLVQHDHLAAFDVKVVARHPSEPPYAHRSPSLRRPHDKQTNNRDTARAERAQSNR